MHGITFMSMKRNENECQPKDERKQTIEKGNTINERKNYMNKRQANVKLAGNVLTLNQEIIVADDGCRSKNENDTRRTTNE